MFGTTVSQALQDQLQIVPGTAQQHIDAVAFGALEMIVFQPAAGF